MLVRLYKDQGCSLPEIKQLIGDQDCDVDNDLGFGDSASMNSVLNSSFESTESMRFSQHCHPTSQQNMQLHQLVVQWIGADRLGRP